MSRIDLNNYEVFLLDYFEGRLSLAEAQQLKQFLLLHPELEIELDEALPYLAPEKETLIERSSLIKTEDDLPDGKLIAYLEGILRADEKRKFERAMEDDAALRSDVELYRKTVLSADVFVFGSKEPLLKNEEQFLLSDRGIRYVEGEMNSAEQRELETELLNNRVLAADIALLKKTRIEPQREIVYPCKEELFKEGRVIALFSRRNMVAAAAALLLLLGLAVVFRNRITGPVNEPYYTKKERNEVFPAENQEVKKDLQVSSDKVQMANVSKKKKQKDKIAGANEGVIVKKQESPLLAGKIQTATTVESTIAATLAVNEAKQDSRIENQKDEEGKPAVNEVLVKQDMLPVEEDEEEEEPVKRKGFWKRAVNFAKQANDLGLKAVNGDEKGKDSYLLSFNSFSIEKK